MSMKMKIPSLWQWPSCKQPKTLSFRASKDDVFKTVNSVYLDIESPESLFTSSSEECASISTDQDQFQDHENKNNSSDESLEMIIQGVRLSERLFFEPGHTSSILKEEDQDQEEVKITSDIDNNNNVVLPFKESVALAMESNNPYMDFKKSMQEMVESHGLKDWDCLEELLAWYLKMNGKINHEYIVGAFVDLLMGLDLNPTSTSRTICCSDSATSYSSVGSSFSSPSSPISSPNVIVQP